MLSPAKIKASEHYETLKNAVEMRHARKHALIYAAVALGSGLFVWLLASLLEDPGASSLAVAAVVLPLCPFSLFYLFRIVDIYRQIDGFCFREGLLNQPRGGMMRGGICFSVEITDRWGCPITVETNSIFSIRGTEEPNLKDYVNQKVLLAYNPDTERVVVIKKLPG